MSRLAQLGVDSHRRPIRQTWPRAGLTLLELLVVIAILAILAGVMTNGFEGLVDKAAISVSTYDVAAIDSSVRAYTVVEGTAPFDLDSLVAAPYVDPGTPVTGAGTKALNLPADIVRKTSDPDGLTQAEFNALANAGILSLRYLDPAGNVNGTGPFTLTAPVLGGGTATVSGGISQADIPARVFDDPRPGANRNRGRGFSGQLGVGSPVIRWRPGGGGYDNLKLGAAPDDVLIVLGLGNYSSIVTNRFDEDPATITGAGAQRARMSSAPFCASTRKDEYNRFLLLYNVGSATRPRSKAVLQAVTDTRGDYRDELFAEQSGQKP